MRRDAVRIAALAFAAFALTARTGFAQGYGVYEHDACAMGRAGTGVASPCSASAMFYNPAGMVRSTGDTRTNKWDLSIGATSIGADFAFQDSVSGTTTNSTGGSVLVPNVFISKQFAERWAFGVGVFAPYGLVSEWPSTGFQGRFLGYRSELKSVYIQPTFAVRVRPWLQLGAGFDYIRTTVDLKQRLDLSPLATTTPGITFANLGVPAGTEFADAHLKGSSWSAGGHVGVILNPTDRVSIGARYMIKAKGDIQGNGYFTQLPTNITLAAGNPLNLPAGTPLDSVVAPQFRGTGALIQQHVSTNVPLPDQLVVGMTVKLTSKATALFDYQWVNWSKFSKLQIQFSQTALGTKTLWEDYQDTHGVRFGLEYMFSERFTARGGVLFHEGAAPDQTVTPLLPEAERAEQTLGLSYRISSHGRIDLAYQHINQADRRGRVVDAPRGSTAFNTGLYTGSANLFGASLAWGF